MTPLEGSPVAGTEQKPIINDFCITFGTVNGSGSATANNTILRALFKMGIPVSGKNIFPSNIQGQPTWYTIRLSKDGYLARLEKDDIVVAMNPATFSKEQEFIVPGGVLFYPDDIKNPVIRDDIIAYPMPIKKLVKDAEVPHTLRDYVSNMVYVGVLAQMLGIDMEKIRMALDFHFKGKQKAVESNLSVIQAAANWAQEHLEKKDPYRVESSNQTEGYVMAEGNVAAAMGAIYGGIEFVGWYPITPASTLVESMMEYAPKLRKDPVTGKDTVVIVQAEDELSAIGMTIGAGWGGLRAMTSTSGPGLSLMAEYLGLAYYSEVPVVVWNVQRVGPSTGLPTRTAQADITETYFISHGDTEFVMLFPGSVRECFDMGWQAFDIAERLQTPVMPMIDLDFGMNNWMTERFEYPDKPMDRGKILWEEDLTKFIEEKGQWGRYLDVDGDGIPYRTVIGNRHPQSAYFTRGTGHDDFARYSEDPVVWEKTMARLKKKMEYAKKLVPTPVIKKKEGAKVGIIAYGSSDPAVIEACDQMAAQGLAVDYLRLRAVPFTDEVGEFIRTHEKIYVVELNRDGQMRQILLINYPEYAMKFEQVSHMDGMPLTARWIRETIMGMEK